MNTQNYWWQIVKVNGETKIKVFDMENNTAVYLHVESVKTMNNDLPKVQSQSGIYKAQEELNNA